MNCRNDEDVMGEAGRQRELKDSIVSCTIVLLGRCFPLYPPTTQFCVRRHSFHPPPNSALGATLSIHHPSLRSSSTNDVRARNATARTQQESCMRINLWNGEWLGEGEGVVGVRPRHGADWRLASPSKKQLRSCITKFKYHNTKK